MRKGKSSFSKVPLKGDILVPWRVYLASFNFFTPFVLGTAFHRGDKAGTGPSQIKYFGLSDQTKSCFGMEFEMLVPVPAI